MIEDPQSLSSRPVHMGRLGTRIVHCRPRNVGVAAMLLALLFLARPVAAQDLQVSTFAGVAGQAGSADGPPGVGRLSGPQDIARAPDGSFYVVQSSHTLRRITPDGTITTVAGLSGTSGSTNGTGSDARFNDPRGVAVHSDGTIYVADRLNCVVRKVTPAGEVTTLAGSPGQCSFLDGTGSAARFGAPEGVAVDTAGTVYVADTFNRRIRKVTPDGVVTTLAGINNPAATIADGPSDTARFAFPVRLTVDAGGNVWVVEWNPGVVRKVTPAGVVSTFAGSTPGYLDATGTAARFNSPYDLALDPAGAIVVADAGNHVIRHIAAAGEVTTVAGTQGAVGTADGLGSAARFSTPYGIEVAADGSVYIADLNNHTIRRGVAVQVVPTGPTPTLDVTTSRGTVALTFSNVSVAGAVTAQAIGSDPTLLGPPPFGNRFVPTAHFDVTSTATFASLNLCVPYVPAEVTAAGLVESELRLFHRPTGSASWIDVTSSVDTAGNRVCGAVTSLSPFAIGGPAVAAFTRYLAEGATSDFFDTQIALLNPGNAATTATLTFLRGGGQAPVVHAVPVPARTRATVDPKTLPGLAVAEFSTVVESDELLIVDRTMSWDASGYGSHAETAVAAPATTWYLAEGATHSGFSLFYLLQNPTSEATTVRVRYLRANAPPLVKDYAVGAASRENIWVNVEDFPGLGTALASAEFSAVIESLDNTPIIVERAMYRSNQGRLFNAGHESMGVTTPSTQWFLAEGATGQYFDLFVLIANPTDTDAVVKLTYLLGDGQTFTRNTVAPANERSGVWVDVEQFDGVPGFPLADVAVSTLVESTNSVPLIVERAMWWPGDFNTWHEAHNSAGATETGTRWALAEGEVGGARGHETYILIANTSAFDGSATVALLFDDGTSAEVVYALPANSRTNVPVALDFPQAAGRRFGAIVESTGGTPAQIVVERAMYSNAGGVTWAAGTNALATKLQ